jgi:peptide/nickel transport system permease protein/oligopeptide transport system permease protein
MSSSGPVTEEQAALPPGLRALEGASGSIWRDARRELIRNPVFVMCSLIVLTVCSWAAFPRLWTDKGKLECDIAINRTPPSWFPGTPPPGYDADLDGYPLGTTTLGCDMYSQLIWGARPSIIVAVVVTLLTALIGTALGLWAGYYGGRVDSVISRITDIFLGLPFLLGALLFLALLKSQSIWAVILVLVVLGWTQMTRIVRGSAISLRDQDFVEAARAMGATNRRIILRHILPNSLAPIIVLCTIYVGSFIAAEATLTFLGVGLKPPEVSWGITIAQGQAFAVAGFPHLLVFPCTVLVVTVLSFILMGDALRDALDPKGR